MSNKIETYDVVIIGAGFSGLYLLRHLRDKGHKVLVLEAGGNIGGVWYWNCYPGARVDTQGALYQFSDPELYSGWDYKELYPSYEGVREYFDYVESKLHLKKDIRFNTKVTTTKFDENENVWVIKADNYEVKGKVLLPCLGFAAKPYFPNIEGMSDFRGPLHHTGLWPQEGLDFTGKRVAIIGTGASAVQVTQEAGKTAKELYVFQRTPNLALPMRQRRLSKEESAELKKGYAHAWEVARTTFGGFDFDNIPKNALEVSDEERVATYDQLWEKGGFPFWLGNFNDVLKDERANRTAYDYWRDQTRKRIKKPELLELLAPMEPPHPFGTKRPCLEQNYFETFNQDNVHLVNLKKTPIKRIVEDGIDTTDAHYEVDIIVIATGFDAISGGLTAVDFIGTNGETLREKWKDGISAHLGMASAAFPNFLFVYGPQSPSGFCNGPTCAELQGDWVIEFVDRMLRGNVKRFEATPEAEAAWRARSIHHHEIFFKTESWYIGANIPGKPREMLIYPKGLPDYLERTAACAKENYSGFVLT